MVPGAFPGQPPGKVLRLAGLFRTQYPNIAGACLHPGEENLPCRPGA